ncbi:MFS general substrate transporter [Zopfia rhizophila CBS 207.26]|uniref:MFS general substrate transporter n=1 Tax=Zopfia rhizophila CBS 207.26 TaxID=1314779 RepID=A0A6A6ENQ3_9PEZI|nr:MFS general substrate transporter [Zopfia rhizophila CBS 207.26]
MTEEINKSPPSPSTPSPQNPPQSPPNTQNSPPIPSNLPFTRPQKALIITLTTLSASLSSISSNIYFPILPTLSSHFSVTPTLINLTVTTYMLFQAFSPTIWGALSDSYGRRMVYLITLTIYVGACIGLAESRKYYQLLILRAVQSTGSASTIALGAGVVGDVTTREERGGYMGWFQAGLLVPLAAGPILGGGLSGGLGWRSVFWALVIFGGVVLVAVGVFLPETLKGLRDGGGWYTRSVLSICRETRKGGIEDVENGVQEIEGTGKKESKVQLDFLSPLKMVFSGEVTCIILFLSLYYTVWQTTITAMSTLFASSYGLSDTKIGLTFIANGVGCILGTITTGRLLDLDYARIKASFTGTTEDFPLEKARLRTIWLWSAAQIASTLVFGWTLDKRVHIAVPIICTFFLGWAATSIQSVVTTFLVDAFSGRSASATAALNMARCLIGAGGTAGILPIAEGIGVGWTFTLCTGFLFAALGLVLVQMRCGSRWRKTREEKEKERKVVSKK